MMDEPTGSEWSFQGCAISGTAKGVWLERIPMLKDYWFDWRNYNRTTTIYRSNGHFAPGGDDHCRGRIGRVFLQRDPTSKERIELRRFAPLSQRAQDQAPSGRQMTDDPQHVI